MRKVKIALRSNSVLATTPSTSGRKKMKQTAINYSIKSLLKKKTVNDVMPLYELPEIVILMYFISVLYNE